VAAQIYKLSAVDMCELAKNSVKQSGFEYAIKQRWLGPEFQLPGVKGNTMAKSNVPNIREGFRHETLLQELAMIDRYTALATPTPMEWKKSEKDSYNLQQPSESPTSSVRTNASSSLLPSEPGAQRYQAFPAQAARQPVTHSQFHLDSQQAAQTDGHSLQSATSRESRRPHSGSIAFSSQISSVAREPSWPVEGFGDLHMAGGEPRIFPGAVSRTQRRDSLRQSSMSETDDYGTVLPWKRGKSGVGKASPGVLAEDDVESVKYAD